MVSRAEAVLAAEDFISGQDYTDECRAKGLAFAFEEGEEALDRQGIMEVTRRRHDTLERKACAAYRWEKDGEAYWTVVFRYTRRLGPRFEGLGRAVRLEEKPWGDLWDPRVERNDVVLAELAANSLL